MFSSLTYTHIYTTTQASPDAAQACLYLAEPQGVLCLKSSPLLHPPPTPHIERIRREASTLPLCLHFLYYYSSEDMSQWGGCLRRLRDCLRQLVLDEVDEETIGLFESEDKVCVSWHLSFYLYFYMSAVPSVSLPSD